MNEIGIKKIASNLRENSVYLLLISPVLLYWIFRIIYLNSWSQIDPAMWYFLDSLAIFTGKSYVFVDHPGTPVQIIGSLFLATTYPFFYSHDNFINYHISNPKLFFLLAYSFQFLINIIVIITIFKTATSYIQNNKILAGIALSWMFFAIHSRSLPTISSWSHNSFNILGTLWLLLLYRAFITDHPPSHKKLFIFGVGAGILSMVQLYLLTWVLAGAIIIFLYHLKNNSSVWGAIKNTRYLLVGCIAGISVSLLPIYREIPRMVNWFVTLAVYDGPYGTGQQSIYSVDLLSISIQAWAQDTWVMYIIFLTGLLLLGMIFFDFRRSKTKISPVDFAFILGLLIHITIQFLLLSKMYYFVRYTLSIAAVMPIFMLSIIILFEKTSLKKTWLQQTAYIIIIIGMLINTTQHIDKHIKNYHHDIRFATSRSLITNTIAQNKGVGKTEIVVVYYDIIPAQCSGLLIANSWIKAFDNQISELCPNQYHINDLEELQNIDWDILVIQNIFQSSENISYLNTIGARRIPNSWGIYRSDWFFLPTNE